MAFLKFFVLAAVLAIVSSKPWGGSRWGTPPFRPGPVRFPQPQRPSAPVWKNGQHTGGVSGSVGPGRQGTIGGTYGWESKDGNTRINAQGQTHLGHGKPIHEANIAIEHKF